MRAAAVSAFLGVCMVMLAGAAYLANRVDYAPRDLARYIVHRAEGHRAVIVRATYYLSRYLDHVDRLSRMESIVRIRSVGAAPSESETADHFSGAYHQVNSMAGFLSAVSSASPGVIIELQPAIYRIDGYGIRITRPGLQNAPIIVRAKRLGQVVFESSAREAFKVSAPYWRFENLVVRGLCEPAQDSDCEHAFHIVGDARRAVLRNNILVDFNAQIKINGEAGSFPDGGIIDRNTIYNTRPRETANPVTPIDLDAASGWEISGNLISDFIKMWGNGVSYGAFAKAAGTNNAFERNVVLCENKLQGVVGERVGVSLGGGGSSSDVRRDQGTSGLEQSNSRISDNLIAFCSDAGIYINRSASSLVEHNTLLDTSGILVRFPQSSVTLEQNIVDGLIANRDGASSTLANNQTPLPLEIYLGVHPQRRLFLDPARLDLRWRESPPRGPSSDFQPDLCGTRRPLHPAIGSFEDFADCLVGSNNAE